MRLGIQLYTVRELTNPADFRPTLRALAALGYEAVEFAWNYGGMSPAELARFLADTGLACCGLHVDLAELLDPGHRVYEYAAATGSRFITTSLCGRMNEWKALIPQVERAGEIATRHGLTFTYHNHWHELSGTPGPCPLDTLWQRTAPAFVQAELDIGWLARAGADPMDYWRRWAARTPQIHLRDFDRRTQQVCDIGDGFIQPRAVVAQAAELGTQWLIYEQDLYPVSPLASARVCIERMKPFLPQTQTHKETP